MKKRRTQFYDPLEKLLRRLDKANAGRPPSMGWYYSKTGDCIFVYFEPVEYYAQRIDSTLTLYRATADGRTIGAMLMGRGVPKSWKIPVNLARPKKHRGP